MRGCTKVQQRRCPLPCVLARRRRTLSERTPLRQYLAHPGSSLTSTGCNWRDGVTKTGWEWFSMETRVNMAMGIKVNWGRKTWEGVRRREHSRKASLVCYDDDGPPSIPEASTHARNMANVRYPAVVRPRKKLHFKLSVRLDRRSK